MVVSDEIKERVLIEIQRCVDVTYNHFGVKVKFPEVLYTLKGTTSGVANYQDWTLKFNSVLLVENTEAFLKRTVPHEIAHLVTHKLYPYVNSSKGGKKRTPHGKEWKSIMILLGADPSRCHQYDTSNVTNKRKTVEYRCDVCNEIVLMSVHRHNKNKQFNGNIYGHKMCNDSTLIPILNNKKQLFKPKKQQVIEIVKTDLSTGKSRKESITKIMDVLSMSKAGASTYYYNAINKW